MDKHIHIVCLDTPFPPDYGGAFEMFYKIRELYRCGLKIHLHCFEYGRGQPRELEAFCETIEYYPRLEGAKGLSFRLPYIVSSRISPELIRCLNADRYPILFEGVHTSWPLLEGTLIPRPTLVRMHNIEYKYYHQLAGQTGAVWKKLFYYNESRLLHTYEQALAQKTKLAAITDLEAKQMSELLLAPDVVHLPAFIGWDYPLSREGIGHFCLYHGNLSVAENEQAANWLLEKVFDKIEIPLVIAGKNPPASLEKKAHQQKHTCLVANPSESELEDLIQKAQIHILPAFSETGVKFKLLHALFCGRHVVVNDPIVKGSGMEAACHIGSSPAALQSIIMQLYHQPFHDDEIQLRAHLMHRIYNNQANAQKIISWLW